jgi:hypothetical protein
MTKPDSKTNIDTPQAPNDDTSQCEEKIHRKANARSA